MHVGEVAIDVALVERLLTQWDGAHGPVREVRSIGTVNAIYRVGAHFYARLPRVGTYAQDLRKELEWLPRLGPRLSLAVPEPMFEGAPGAGYPFPWAVYRWLDGAPYDGVDDEPAAARVLDGNDGRCADVNPANADAYEFAHGSPCPATWAGTVSVDTTTWPRGEHRVTVLVEDAGHNTRPVLDRVTRIAG